MRRRFLLLGLSLFALGATACSKSDVKIELVFPDEFTANLAAGPDGEPMNVTAVLTVTAIEPFASEQSLEGPGAKRVVVRCGDLGVFPPTTKFDRSENEIPNLAQPLANRLVEGYPLSDTWTVDIPEPKSGNDVNPWGAVLVHIEARGKGRDYDSANGLDPTPGDETLLEGCYCMRLKENADLSALPDDEKELDAQILDACVPASAWETEPLRVPLEPVMAPVFDLLPAGVTSLVAVSGQSMTLAPGVEIDTIECSQATTSGSCFQCASQSCNELKDKSNVPLRVEVVGVEDSRLVYVRPENRILLTDDQGHVVPQIEVESCVADFQVVVSLVGRATEFVTFDVKCVDAVRFASDRFDDFVLDAPIGLQAVPRVIGQLPGARVGGVDAPARPVVISLLRDETDEDAPPTTRVDILTAQGNRLAAQTSIEFPDEFPRGVFGYYYDYTGGVPTRPVLAVVTSSVVRKHEELKLRIYEVDGDGTHRELAAMSGACRTCGCSQPVFCEACTTDPEGDVVGTAGCVDTADCKSIYETKCQNDPNCPDKEKQCADGDCYCDPSAPAIPQNKAGQCRVILGCDSSADCDKTCTDGDCYCDGSATPRGETRSGVCLAEPCFSSVKPNTIVRMSAEDLNGDGYADLALAADNDFVMTTFYSAPHRHQVGGGQLGLPPLDQVCKCASMGKLLQTFEFAQFGGEKDTRASRAVDVIMGDATGAFLRYAEEDRLDGLACDPAASASAIQTTCGTGNICESVCEPDFVGQGRCVTPCSAGDNSPCTNPLQPNCTEIPPQSGRWMCAGPTIGCRAPDSVWELTGVSDVVSARIRPGSPFEDAIAVAQGSPVPGNLETGKVRILYGGNLDLTEVDRMPKEVKKESILDLAPVKLNDATPQGAKSAVVGDFNDDGFDDFAVLFGTSEEIRVWVGGGADAPAELTTDLDDAEKVRAIRLKSGADRECFPLADFVAGDFDGDRRSEILVVCNTIEEQSVPSRLRWFRPE